MHLLTTSLLADAQFAAFLEFAAPFWNATFFQKPYWVDFMFFLRVCLCLVGGVLLVAEVRARRLGTQVPKKLIAAIAIAMTVLSFGAYFDFGNPNVRYREYYHRHELYHYYLGSKYFDELGYTRLYDCTLVAEIDNGRRSQVANREFRDLRVNLIKKAKDTYVLSDPDQCRDRFSAARWEDFKQDVDWFHDSAAGSYWERMQQDHGYNPPPVWTMAGKFLGSFAPAGDTFFKLLASIDVALQLGMVGLLGWAFGLRTMAVCTIFWGCNAAANFYWTGGAFLRQDWIFLLVASVCFCRKRMFFWAGFALMWSALLRVFPAVLYFGWGVMILAYVLRRFMGRPSADGKTGPLSYLLPSHRGLILGSLVALAVLVPASIKTAGGVAAYKEFVSHIAVHKKTPLTNHMGLPTIVTHTWDGRMRFTRDNSLDDAFERWKDGRNERAEARKPLILGISLLLALWGAWALRRTQLLWVGPAFGLPLVMCATDLTCYYYSMFIVMGVVAKARKPLGPVFLAVGAASTILLGRDIGYARIAWGGFYFVDDNFAVQSYLFFLLCVLMLFAYSRPFSVARLQAWLRGRREPRAGVATYPAAERPALPAE